MFCVEFDVGTVTTLSGPRSGGGTDVGEFGSGQEDGADLAAAPVAVCAGTFLCLPGRPGHGVAVVDTNLGQKRVHPRPAMAGVCAAQWRSARHDLWTGTSGHLDWHFGGGALSRLPWVKRKWMNNQ